MFEELHCGVTQGKLRYFMLMPSNFCVSQGFCLLSERMGLFLLVMPNVV